MYYRLTARLDVISRQWSLFVGDESVNCSFVVADEMFVRWSTSDERRRRQRRSTLIGSLLADAGQQWSNCCWYRRAALLSRSQPIHHPTAAVIAVDRGPTNSSRHFLSLVESSDPFFSKLPFIVLSIIPAAEVDHDLLLLQYYDIINRRLSIL